MKNSSRPKDLVIDFFGGSGTTLISSEECDRVCFTMEIDEKYASAIVRRYVKAKGSPSDVICIRDGKEYKGSDIYNFEEENVLL